MTKIVDRYVVHIVLKVALANRGRVVAPSHHNRANVVKRDIVYHKKIKSYAITFLNKFLFSILGISIQNLLLMKSYYSECFNIINRIILLCNSFDVAIFVCLIWKF